MPLSPDEASSAVRGDVSPVSPFALPEPAGSQSRSLPPCGLDPLHTIRQQVSAEEVSDGLCNRKIVQPGVPARKPLPVRKPVPVRKPLPARKHLPEHKTVVPEPALQAGTTPIVIRAPTQQAACTGKTYGLTFDDYQVGIRAEVHDEKIVPNFVRPVFVGDGDTAAANAVATFIEQRYHAQVEAHNLAIDERKQMEGSGSLLISATDLKLLCNNQTGTLLYTQAIKNAGMTREQFNMTLDRITSTYHITKDQTDWSRITESVLIGAITFGIGALPLLDREQRTKSDVKEGAVLAELRVINADLRSQGVEAQWELRKEGVPFRWVLRMHRVPL